LRESDVNDSVAPRQHEAGSVSNESQSSRPFGIDPAIALQMSTISQHFGSLLDIHRNSESVTATIVKIIPGVTAQLTRLSQATENVFQAMLKSEEVDEIRSQLQAKDQELTAAQSALQVYRWLRFNAPPDGLPLTLHFAEGAIGC
jgi:hypothetical protein